MHCHIWYQSKAACTWASGLLARCRLVTASAGGLLKPTWRLATRGCGTPFSGGFVQTEPFGRLTSVGKMVYLCLKKSMILH